MSLDYELYKLVFGKPTINPLTYQNYDDSQLETFKQNQQRKLEGEKTIQLVDTIGGFALSGLTLLRPELSVVTGPAGIVLEAQGLQSEIDTETYKLRIQEVSAEQQQRQEFVTVTRVGRIVSPPMWQKDP